jgi:hypothetical protein
MSVAGGSVAGMAHWSDIEAESPDLATTARRILDAHKHKTIATLRRDGSPRISGIELLFHGGDVWFGGMYRSVKCLDLLRDPRFALHSASVDPPGSDPGAWAGDAKFAGVAVEVSDPELVAAVVGDNAPPGPLHLFRADVRELVLTRVGEPADHLLIESWHAGRGVRSVQRH